MPARRELPAVTKNGNHPQLVKHLNPMALGQSGTYRYLRSRVTGLLADSGQNCILGKLCGGTNLILAFVEPLSLQ